MLFDTEGRPPPGGYAAGGGPAFIAFPCERARAVDSGGVRTRITMKHHPGRERRDSSIPWRMLAGRRPRIGSHERARGSYVNRARSHGRRGDTKGEADRGDADRLPLESERAICEDHGASRPAEGAGRAGDGRFQDGQLVGCGSSIFLWAPCGRSCTAIVSAGMLLSFRSMCTSLPPASTNPCPAVYGWPVQVGSSPM